MGDCFLHPNPVAAKDIQQLTQWEAPGNGIDALRKLLIIGRITFEEFRRPILSFPILNNANDPDGKKRKEYLKLATRYNVTRVRIRTKATREYYDQRLKKLKNDPQAWEMINELRLERYECEMKVQIDDSVNVLDQPLAKLLTFRPFCESILGWDAVEEGEHRKQDEFAMVRVILWTYRIQSPPPLKKHRRSNTIKESISSHVGYPPYEALSGVPFSLHYTQVSKISLPPTH